jgi:hypothetical protein
LRLNKSNTDNLARHTVTKGVSMRASLTVVALVALLFAGGCTQISSPALPTSISSAPSFVLAPTGTAPTFGTTALEDSSLNGSAYLLDSVSATSMTFHNSQNTYTAVYDGTTFRRAVLQSWLPSDPYYGAASAYNAGDPLGDSWVGILQGLQGGHARIIVPPNPVLPTDPYRIQSFQPIP